ncbi:hypothetical protein WGP40_10360 [Brachymonas sp. G13]|uniref:hypothetical protein n=1 Tax=Brachymonas wangyanguii TaxID=3130163 RepID=UPI00307E3B44
MSVKTIPTARIADITKFMVKASGLSNTTSQRAQRALALIDGERVSSITGIMQAHGQRIDAIHADRELSSEGKAARGRTAAASVFGNVASVAREIAALDAEYRAEMQKAIVIPEASVNDTLIDLALAASVKAANPTPTALTMASERTRQALARIPVELSGLTPEVQARVVGSLISPADAVRFGEEAEAIDTARQVAQAAIDELQPIAQWTPAEMVKHVGHDTGYRLPGVVQSLADKLAANQAADATE